MTFSDAWIDTVDDDEFAAVLKEERARDLPYAERIFKLPPPPSPYWITVVRQWASSTGLTVEEVDPLESRARVSRAQLLRFLDDTFREAGDPALQRTPLLGVLFPLGLPGRAFGVN